MAETLLNMAEFQSDHDIIVELRTEFRGMRADIQNLTFATTLKTDDHEKRLRTIENEMTDVRATSKAWRYGLSVAIAIATIATTFISVLIHK